MLECKICGYQHPTMISPSHLKKHNISADQYKALYPGSVLRIHSAEAKAKMSEAKKGTNAWNKGIKTGPNIKLSNAIKGKSRPRLVGKTRTVEQRNNISIGTKLGMIGVMTDDVKKKLSDVISRKKQLGTYIAPMQGKTVSDLTKSKIRATLKETNNKKSNDIIDSFINIAKDQNIDVISVDSQYWFNFECGTCNNSFTFSRQIFRPSARNSIDICPHCNPRNIVRSKMEEDFFNCIKSLEPSAVANDRNILNGKELDVYIESSKIAFEFTGLYWHSEKIASVRNNLKIKHDMASKLGIRLITVFEDEWVNSKDIVLSRIRTILGKNQKKVFARKCKIKEIDSNEAKSFLNANHLQRADTSSKRLGLYFDEMLVSIATFKKTNMSKGGDGNDWELSRFCNLLGYTVVGGASKLFSYFMKHLNIDRLDLISFADSRWSNGNLYKTTGFKFESVTPPNFWYFFNGSKRIHRASLMKHKLVKSESDKLFTGWELAQQLGYNRIWDCGNTKWRLSFPLE